MEEVKVPEGRPIRLLQWLVKAGDWVKYGKPVLVYRHIEDPSTGVKTKELQLKSRNVGCVKKLCMEVGQVATPGRALLELESCTHPVVMKDMCAECGQDLRLLEEGKVDNCARVSMVPNIPELKISSQQAEELGKQDKDRLHKLRKLVLLVDLDQTLIHTTQKSEFASICSDNPNFFIYNLHKSEPTLYTKIRPHCRQFLEEISKLYELQIVTFGSRQYAHKIAEFIDPEGKYFAHRILSRDECVNPMRKSGNLQHLFPCGDSMVCIIDDRDDVWNRVPNLVLVRKYSYFPGAGDINSPDRVEAVRGAGDNAAGENDSLKQPRKRKPAMHGGEQSHKVSRSSDVEETGGKAGLADEDSSCSSSVVSTSKTKDQNTSEVSSSVDSRQTENGSAGVEGSEASSSTSNSPKRKDFPCDAATNLTDNHHGSSDHHESSDHHGSNDHHGSSDHHGSNDRLAVSPDSTTEGDVTSTTKDEVSSDKMNERIPDHDDYLLYLQHILTRVHTTYYGAYDKFLKKEFDDCPDLRGVVPFIRSEILYGCRLVLTGVIPNNYKASHEQHKVHVIARQLGATIDDHIGERTTHLIGGKKGTAKYQEAQKRGNIKLVSVAWLWCCSERWEKVSEDLFPIPKNRSNPSSSREGTPPVTKAVRWDTTTRTYNPVTGKLVKNAEPRFELIAEEAARMQEFASQKAASPRFERVAEEQMKMHEISLPDSRSSSEPMFEPIAREAIKVDELTRPDSLYSSLKDPQVVVPVKVSVSCEPSTSTTAAAVRSRKPSMAEVMGIEYSLSSNDISEMDKEVDDLLSSEEEADNNLGTIISTSSSSDNSTQAQLFTEESKKSKSDESSSSEEEFDHMAEMLDHEMHYDEDNSDLDALD